MAQEASLWSIALSVLALMAELFSVIGCLFLIVHRFWPKTSYLPALKVVWLGIVVCALAALVVLVYRHFSIAPSNSSERLGTYIWGITLSPILVSGVIALFLRPR